MCPMPNVRGMNRALQNLFGTTAYLRDGKLPGGGTQDLDTHSVLIFVRTHKNSLTNAFDLRNSR